MAVQIKRAYEKAAAGDGVRVLVDRLWPRGITKTAARIDRWMKDLAPSDELRKWYHARPEQWLAFRKRYLEELKEPEAALALDELYEIASARKRVTLVYASREEKHNNAAVLRDLLNGMKKPPRSTGPAGEAAAGRMRARARVPRR
jgi:uncharacterized protein YeaO (DUF488 family)